MQGRIGKPFRRVAGWSLWHIPSKTLRGYVLVVYGAAAAVTAATAFLMPVTAVDLTRFGALACCAVVCIELTRRVERQREYLRAATAPYQDTKSVWSFAAVLVLPPSLASAMVVLTYAAAWWRVWPRRQRPVPPYRWAFSGSTVLCGTQAAVAVLALGMHRYPGVPEPSIPSGLADLGVVAAAALLRWLVNAALVMAAILLANPEAGIADLVRSFSEHLAEAGAMGLGLVAATLVVDNPVVLAGVVLALVVMHRVLLLRQYQSQARTDPKTGLATAGRWQELAEQSLARAQDRGSTLGMLMVDLDHFKDINDQRGGHLAGDRVLAAVGEALRAETREQDVCGRYGGDELAVLIPDVGTPENLLAIAERIRRRVRALRVEIPAADDLDAVEITDLTVSIGAAMSPAAGVDDLVRRADAALYRAKSDGRDRTCLSPDPGPGPGRRRSANT
ncbi:GGDEF domain-containing protein [Amycolatopsis sp. NPDC004079]|uniref:GGDEF domain-containing protein n=1 Tax=Amycolatopsis sp. NPDC004079 TaxID=3154549 RepID=UPI0033B6EDB5